MVRPRGADGNTVNHRFRSLAYPTPWPDQPPATLWLLNPGPLRFCAAHLGYGGYGLSVLSCPAPSFAGHRQGAPQRHHPVGALRIMFSRRPL